MQLKYFPLTIACAQSSLFSGKVLPRSPCLRAAFSLPDWILPGSGLSPVALFDAISFHQVRDWYIIFKVRPRMTIRTGQGLMERQFISDRQVHSLERHFHGQCEISILHVAHRLRAPVGSSYRLFEIEIPQVNGIEGPREGAPIKIERSRPETDPASPRSIRTHHLRCSIRRAGIRKAGSPAP